MSKATTRLSAVEAKIEKLTKDLADLKAEKKQLKDTIKAEKK
jgi:predicted transcriptional regulator